VSCVMCLSFYRVCLWWWNSHVLCSHFSFTVGKEEAKADLYCSAYLCLSIPVCCVFIMASGAPQQQEFRGRRGKVVVDFKEKRKERGQRILCFLYEAVFMCGLSFLSPPRPSLAPTPICSFCLSYTNTHIHTHSIPVPATLFRSSLLSLYPPPTRITNTETHIHTHINPVRLREKHEMEVICIVV
jgi:hypothetical protein